MNIAIDCFKLVKGQGKSIGIYNYTKNLIDNLAKENKNATIYVFGNLFNREDFSVTNINFIEIKFNPINKMICILWELIYVLYYLRKFKIDIVFFPRGFMPLIRTVKSIVTIHDLIPFYYQKNYPEYINRLESFYIRNRLISSIKNASKIITISEYSKKDILKLNKNVSKKIQVIYNGFNMINLLDNIPSNDQEEYIFAITSELPHKNLISVLKSYEKYHNQVEKPLKLRVVGVKNIEKYSNIIEKNIFNTIIFEGFLTDEKFYKIFKNAKIFIFLSLVEGFGFPPLEAMSLGVPVICSNKTSLPEVVGDACIMVNPKDYDSISESIIYLSKNENKRKELIVKGYENIKRFKWQDKVLDYIQVFRDLNNEISS